MDIDKTIKKYADMYRYGLKMQHFSDVSEKVRRYSKRLGKMYCSQKFAEHNVYPTMNAETIYAVIAMCLELKEYGMSDKEMISFSKLVFHKRRRFFDILTKCIGILPNCYSIARKWNISDHEKRVRDGSITYDKFIVTDGKIEYKISKCMYVEMFEYYGIRQLCKIFCLTDEYSYANLKRHIRFIRHSDLSDGNCCHDEVIEKR